MCRNKFLFALIVSVLVAGFCVGCSGEPEGDVVNVGFSAGSDISRNLAADFDGMYKPEELFWSYTAEKTDGIHCKGETFTELPVSFNGDRGLKGHRRQFSKGSWKFSVYAYVSSTDYKTADDDARAALCIYCSEGKEVTLSADGTVDFAIGYGAGYPDRAYLKFGELSMKVPEGMAYNFTSGKKIKVDVYDADSATPVLIATSTTTLSAAFTDGEVVELSAPVLQTVAGRKSAKGYSYTEGQHCLKFEVFSGTVPVLNGAEYVAVDAGSFVTVKKSLDRLPVVRPIGGKIYSIDTRSSESDTGTGGVVGSQVTGNANGEIVLGNVTYTFYKADGKPVNLSGKTYKLKYDAEGLPVSKNIGSSTAVIEKCPLYFTDPDTHSLLTALADNTNGAVYYKTDKMPSKDRFYVWGPTLLSLSASDGTLWMPVCFGGAGHNFFSAEERGEYGEKLIGSFRGKYNSSRIMSPDNLLYATNYPACKKPDETVGGSRVYYGTIWCYVYWMNTGDGVTYKTFSGWNSVRRIDGCNDWYVPTPGDILNVYKCNTDGFIPVMETAPTSKVTLPGVFWPKFTANWITSSECDANSIHYMYTHSTAVANTKDYCTVGGSETLLHRGKSCFMGGISTSGTSKSGACVYPLIRSF